MSTSGKAIRGFGWFFLNSMSSRVLRLLNRLIVAKLLVPEEFGLAVLAITIVGLFETIRTIGFDDALVALQDEDETAANTAFWILTAVGILLTSIVVLIAPVAGMVFDRVRLVLPLQVLAIVLTLRSLETVPSTVLQKELEFKKKLLPGVFPPIVYTTVAVALAATGFGLWSLIVGQVASAIVSVLANWIVAGYVPAVEFSRNMTRELFGFGSHIAVASVAGKLYQRLDDLVVGWLLGPAVLAAYNIGYLFGNLPAEAITKPATPVLYPALSRLQEKDRGSAWMFTVRMVAMVSIPMGVGIIIIAPMFVTATLGSKYQDAVPLVRIISIYGIVRSVSAASGPVLKSSGSVRVLSRLMIVHACLFAIIVIPLTITFGAMGTAVAVLLSSVPNNFGQFYYAVRELNVSLGDTLVTFLPYVIYSGIMAVGVIIVDILTAGISFFNLLLLVTVGVLIYIGQLLLFEQQFLIFCSRTVTNAYTN